MQLDDVTRAWASSGGMWLTGHPNGAPLLLDGPFIERLTTAAAQVEHYGGVPIDLHAVISGRACAYGLVRQGRVSANGTCRLLRARDGWFALNLARDTDLEAIPALFCATADSVADPIGDSDSPWELIEDLARNTSAAAIVGQARLLGIPASVLGEAAFGPSDPAPLPWRVVRHGARGASTTPVVIDFSALWAGPLCASLLGRAGANVIKVESMHRPDPMRSGPRSFYDSLHSGHDLATFDFSDARDLARLRELVASADIVIEASRPRALKQLGLEPEHFLAGGAGRTWISITGYGRTGPRAGHVALGDDAAISGGLVAYDQHTEPVFCADAIADPLTGINAAAVALQSMAEGGGCLIDISMSSVAAYHAGPRTGPGHMATVGRCPDGGNDEWNLALASGDVRVARPSVPLVA